MAAASTASVSIKRVFYAAAPGEVNQLTVSASGADFALSRPGCAHPARRRLHRRPRRASSARARGSIGFTLSGGDGGDSLENTTSLPATFSGGDGADSLKGGSGNDILRGNQGVDTVSAGAGDDFVDVRGDRADIVTCGPGADTVRAYGSDLIGSDCEQVDLCGAPALPLPRSPPPADCSVRWRPPRSAGAGRVCLRQARHTGRGPARGNRRWATTCSGCRATTFIVGARPGRLPVRRPGLRPARPAPAETTACSATTPAAACPAATACGEPSGDDLLDGGPGADPACSGLRGKDRLVAGGGRNVLLGGPGNDRLNATPTAGATRRAAAAAPTHARVDTPPTAYAAASTSGGSTAEAAWRGL